MGQSQGLSLAGAVCLRCALKPKATEALPSPLPTKDWWKLAIDITDQNQRSCDEEFSILKQSVQKQLLAIMKCAGEPFTYSKGQILLKEGDTNATLYMIESGICEVSVMLGAVRTTIGVKGGIPTVVAKLSTDDVVGEISFVLGCPASATVTVSSECAAFRKIEMKDCARLLDSAGIKAKDLLKQIAFKLSEKLELADNSKLSQLQLQKERQDRAQALALSAKIGDCDFDPSALKASIRYSVYKCMFDKFDAHSSGSISISECKNVFRECGVECNPKILQVMIARYDANENGQIEFDEFMRLIEDVSSEKAQVRKALDSESFHIIFMCYRKRPC
jgi:CRP-like cAMP-binding protein